MFLLMAVAQTRDALGDVAVFTLWPKSAECHHKGPERVQDRHADSHSNDVAKHNKDLDRAERQHNHTSDGCQGSAEDAVANLHHSCLSSPEAAPGLGVVVDVAQVQGVVHGQTHNDRQRDRLDCSQGPALEHEVCKHGDNDAQHQDNCHDGDPKVACENDNRDEGDCHGDGQRAGSAFDKLDLYHHARPLPTRAGLQGIWRGSRLSAVCSFQKRIPFVIRCFESVARAVFAGQGGETQRKVLDTDFLGNRVQLKAEVVLYQAVVLSKVPRAVEQDL
mmetsp:Transcript_1232/g.1647  ORF Transcript_1232/g.1647 Transcript_1232/m.1647 type:complete len:276 (+) Transcript_1232:460-1287(+)